MPNKPYKPPGTFSVTIVVGFDSNKIPKVLGSTETYEEADKLKNSGTLTGWPTLVEP